MSAHFRIERRTWLLPEMESQLEGTTVVGRVQIFDLQQNDTAGLTGLLLRDAAGHLLTVHYDRPSRVLIVLYAEDPAECELVDGPQTP